MPFKLPETLSTGSTRAAGLKGPAQIGWMSPVLLEEDLTAASTDAAVDRLGFSGYGSPVFAELRKDEESGASRRVRTVDLRG